MHFPNCINSVSDKHAKYTFAENDNFHTVHPALEDLCHFLLPLQSSYKNKGLIMITAVTEASVCCSESYSAREMGFCFQYDSLYFIFIFYLKAHF